MSDSPTSNPNYERLQLIRRTVMDLERTGHKCDWGTEADIKWLLGEVDRLRDTVRKVHIHTGLPPHPTHELLFDLMLSIGRITATAMDGAPDETTAQPFTPYRSLDYLKTPEDLEAYVQERIRLATAENGTPGQSV